MSNLRKEVIKLANRKPELRNVLLPLLKESSSTMSTAFKVVSKEFEDARNIGYAQSLGHSMDSPMIASWNHSKKSLSFFKDAAHTLGRISTAIQRGEEPEQYLLMELAQSILLGQEASGKAQGLKFKDPRDMR